MIRVVAFNITLAVQIDRCKVVADDPPITPLPAFTDLVMTA